jgi:hypothetical protein
MKNWLRLIPFFMKFAESTNCGADYMNLTEQGDGLLID